MPPDDSDIVQLLNGYRPAQPAASLREKVLSAVPIERAATAPTRRWPLYAFRGSIAAALIFSFALLHEAGEINRTTAANIGIGAPRWTPEAQQAADMMDVDAAGQRYIALHLIAGYRSASTTRGTEGVTQ